MERGPSQPPRRAEWRGGEGPPTYCRVCAGTVMDHPSDGPSLRRAHCSDGKTEVPAGELTRPSHTARNTGQALSQAPLPPSKGVAQSSSWLGSCHH